MIKRPFPTLTYSSFFTKVLLVIILAFTSCKSKQKQDKAYIYLESGNFCSAGPVDKLAGIKLILRHPSPKAKAAIQDVLGFSGVPANIEIYEGNVGNALATEEEGRKMIIYNENFLDEIDKKSGQYWQTIFIIAHEIGHLLSDHFRNKNLQLNHQKELDADKFAGYILYRLGAEKKQCTWIMNTSLLQDSKGSITHPAKNKRIASINDGYDSALRQSFNIPDPPPPLVNAEELGESFDCFKFDHGEINTFYTLEYPTCGFEETIRAKKNIYQDLIKEPFFAEYIIRDSLIGVILKLESSEFSENSGWLYSTSAIIRLKKYNKTLNPSLKSQEIIVTGITDPGRSEEGSYRFAKFFKAGQRIKFMVSPVNTEGIVPVQKMYYLEFLPPENL